MEIVLALIALIIVVKIDRIVSKMIGVVLLVCSVALAIYGCSPAQSLTGDGTGEITGSYTAYEDSAVTASAATDEPETELPYTEAEAAGTDVPDTEAQTPAETTAASDTTASPETTAAPETSKTPETTAKAPETTASPETTAKPASGSSAKAPQPEVGDPSNWTSVYLGTAEQDAEARKIAKQIADSIGPGSDLERIQKATLMVAQYDCKYADNKNVYMTAYSVFKLGKSCCWGYTSALGMVLDYMGYKWQRGNKGVDKTYGETFMGGKHQWVIVTDMDGHVGYADADACAAYYGIYGCSDYSFCEAHGENNLSEAVIKSATCTEDGSGIYTCRVCGAKEEKAHVIPAGHDGVAGEVVAPTESTAGYTLYTCRVCGETYKDDITFATRYCDELGHEHIWGLSVDEFPDRKLLWDPNHFSKEFDGLWSDYMCEVCGILSDEYYDLKCRREHGDHFWVLDYNEEYYPGAPTGAICYYCGFFSYPYYDLDYIEVHEPGSTP